MKSINRLMLLVCAMALATVSYSQANYWGLYFGMGDHPSFPKYKLDCNQVPAPDATGTGTFTPLLHEVYDDLGLNFQIEGLNSIFNFNGDPLFSADINGIYNVTTKTTSYCCPVITNLIYGFSSPSTYQVLSEIEIFPVPFNCDKYYVLFWQHEYDISIGDNAGLREIVVNTSTNTPSIVSDRFIDHVPYVAEGIYGIVADAIRTMGNRAVYALYPSGSGTLNIDNWIYDRAGGISGLSYYTPTLPEAGSRIFELTDDRTIAYISADLTKLNTYNVNTATFKSYTPLRGTIRGFEYVPERNYWYISYFLPPAVPYYANGGIGVFDLNTSSATYTELAAAPASSYPGSTAYIVHHMAWCNATDLELAKNGYLYLAVDGDDVFSRNGYRYEQGSLAYINTNDPVKAMQGPIFAYTSTGPGGVPVQINSTIDNGLSGCCSGMTGWTNGRSFYINNQIDFEDYDGYFRPTSDPNSFTINHQAPSIYIPNPCPATTETFQDICFGSPIEFEFSPRISGDETMTMVHWDEIDDCGNHPPSGLSGHSATMAWQGPFDVLDLASLPAGPGIKFTNPAVIGKKFLIYFEVGSACKNTWNTYTANIRIVSPDPVTNLQVTNDPSGTSYVSLSTACSSAPAACGMHPYIKFSQTGIDYYWMTITDYGSGCTGTPTLVGSGAASHTPVSPGAPPDIVEGLPEYLWQYCSGFPTLADAINYFTTNSGHVYGVQVYAQNICGIQMMDELYFAGGLPCKGGSTGIAGTGMQSEVRIYPNPANDYLKIDCSKDMVNATFNVKDVAGKQLAGGVVHDSGQSVDISALAPGIYIFEISAQDKKVQNIRFTKQ